MFVACGQDVANVAESSAGFILSELRPDGKYYISVTIPCLVVATIGGGTGLPTQRECLEVLGCYGVSADGQGHRGPKSNGDASAHEPPAQLIQIWVGQMEPPIIPNVGWPCGVVGLLKFCTLGLPMTAHTAWSSHR